MRKFLVVVCAAVLSISVAGCINIVSVRDPGRLDGKRRIIEVEKQLYVVDVEARTVTPVESRREARQLLDGD